MKILRVLFFMTATLRYQQEPLKLVTIHLHKTVTSCLNNNSSVLIAKG